MNTRIHEIHIRATAEAIWEALTAPEWTNRYGYRASQHFELRTGGAFQAKANA